mmetsp:Transcript_35963/g.67084  ORF Transcript_35963/g.67084 Transcript_35963/m.67084 type:complete len:592 (+) Transcript_35963:228-2003(+)
MCKVAEAAYLDLYKAFRDAPDPLELVARATGAAEGALAGFARVEVIFSQLEQSQALQEEFRSSAQDNNSLIKNDEEFQDRLKVDMAEVASSYDIELKKREQIFRDTFEQQKLQAQQKFDAALAQKDAELLSLNESLLALQQAANWSSENQALLQAEVDRREAAEDKARAAARESADLRESLDEHKARLGEEETDLSVARATAESLSVQLEQLQQEQRRRDEQHLTEVSSLQGALRAMPSFDLGALAEKLYVLGPEGSTPHPLPTRSPVKTQSNVDSPIHWAEIEEWLVATVRKSQSEASMLRARDHERQCLIEKLEKTVESLSTEVDDKRKSMVTLEQNLTAAYSSIEAGKALLQCHGMLAGSKAVGATEQSMSIFTPAGVGSEGTAAGDKDVMMMKAVLEQRDRMMKQAHSKQQEATKLQTLVERLEHDKTTLKLENTELYRRLRVIRVNCMASSSAGGGGGGAALQSANVKKRSTGGGDLGGDDDVEAKYAQQYEEHLDVFQLEALDRQVVMSRMNICEQGLGYVVRFVMQDRWMRHALLFYLLIVHAFAVGYTFVVLNPDIEREIDEQWSRISKEDMNQEVMHPDNWA